MKPNLFDYATSELSQDAVLCWLLAWAKPECAPYDIQMHQVGLDLVKLMYTKSGREMPAEISKLEIRHQHCKVDILCLVNDDTAIIIEDKVGTQQHSDQLIRYQATISQLLGFAPSNIIGIYLQTGDQCEYSEVAAHGFTVLSRTDLLSVLESPTALKASEKSDILGSFKLHLRKIEDAFQGYCHLPLEQWTDHAWRGLFTELGARLNGRWHYVPNQSGGFIGFYWHFQQTSECTVYLQIEKERLCFKIQNLNSERNPSSVRNLWSSRILKSSEMHGFTVTRPGRFGKGENMTVAVLDNFLTQFDNGALDLEDTIRIMEVAQRIIDDCLHSAKDALVNSQG